jgi:hypothetical protein
LILPDQHGNNKNKRLLIVHGASEIV